MVYKGKVPDIELERHTDIFDGYKSGTQSAVNEGLRKSIERRFTPYFNVGDHGRWLEDTFNACRGFPGQSPASLVPRLDSNNRWVFSAQLYLPSDPPQETDPVMMTRVFEGTRSTNRLGDTRISWHSNTDQYHDPVSGRTVTVSSKFDPDTAVYQEFQYLGAEKDFFRVTVGETDGKKVLEVTYADRTGTIVTEIPPALLGPIQAWATKNRIPINSTDSVN